MKQVSALTNIFVKDIDCGESHTVALTDKGEVYTWGGGLLGQLGHGDYFRQTLPIKVANLADSEIVQLSCGKRHTAAINADGVLYTWGSNEHG